MNEQQVRDAVERFKAEGGIIKRMDDQPAPQLRRVRSLLMCNSSPYERMGQVSHAFGTKAKKISAAAKARVNRGLEQWVLY